MCIAILNTKKHTISKKHLKNCWDNNGDGAGILYINGENKLDVFKEMDSFTDFYKMYSYIKQEHGHSNIVLHFRISTHGKVNKTNCHPFLVSENVGFVHNGMIYDVPTHPDYSDTYLFNELYLKMMKDGFEQNEAMLDMIESYIGAGNKLVFLNDNNDYSIVNESKGHWYMGSWFSNYSYEQVNSWVDYGGVKKSKSSLGVTKNNTVEWGFDDEVESWKDANRSYCGCGVTLYGEHELKNNKCHWCEEDEAKAQEEDAFGYKLGSAPDTIIHGYCDCCDEEAKVTYHQAWHSYICEKCEDELQKDGYLGA